MNAPVSDHKRKLLRISVRIVCVVVIIVLGVYVAFQVSPWPSVLLVRYSFKSEGGSMNESVAKYVPHGIASTSNIPYEHRDGGETLDLYYQENQDARLPLVVWVHGGGFIAGDKKDLSNYGKMLASKNYVVAAINYTVAPEARYPNPVRQLDEAIAFLARHSEEYKIDTTRIIVGGDSGGAHIAAQFANVYTDSEYAALLEIKPSIDPANLKGVILFCGPYNTDFVDFEGTYGKFLNTVLWCYIGSKKFVNNPKFAHFSVSKFVTSKFPPTFLSVGNNDPLRAHSYDLASKLSARGVVVDSLFFPDNYLPALPHEYQFDFNSKESKVALERTVNFISVCVNTPNQ